MSYMVLCNAHGDSPESIAVPTGIAQSNTNNFDNGFELIVSLSRYVQATNTHDFTVSARTNHPDFVGEYHIEVEGINSSSYQHAQKKIIFRENKAFLERLRQEDLEGVELWHEVNNLDG